MSPRQGPERSPRFPSVSGLRGRRGVDARRTQRWVPAPRSLRRGASRGRPAPPAGSAVNVKELGACFWILFRFSFLGNLQPGPLGLQETAFRKGMRTWARDGLRKQREGVRGVCGAARSDGGGSFPESPRPSPCPPATCPRKVGVTLTAGVGGRHGESLVFLLGSVA